jgi:PhnB protein
MNEKNKPTNASQIHAVIEEWADALRNKDAHRVLSHYAPGAVHFSLAPPLLSTESNKEGLLNAEGLNAWFATWDGPIGYEIGDPGILISGDIAFSFSLNRMQGTKTDGAKADLWFRQTFGFQRQYPFI